MIKIINTELDIFKCKVPKKWGKEIIFHNDKNYCGKLLIFNKGAKFSMHYHLLKKETWFIKEGTFLIKYIDTKDATLYERELIPGMAIEINPGDPHQLVSKTGGIIFEVSTQHFDNDSYRIEKGDSQC